MDKRKSAKLEEAVEYIQLHRKKLLLSCEAAESAIENLLSIENMTNKEYYEISKDLKESKKIGTIEAKEFFTIVMGGLGLERKRKAAEKEKEKRKANEI